MVVQTPEEGKRPRGLPAVYGQNCHLSLRCLLLAEGGVSNRGESIHCPRRTSIGVVPVWFVHYDRYIVSSYLSGHSSRYQKISPPLLGLCDITIISCIAIYLLISRYDIFCLLSR